MEPNFGNTACLECGKKLLGRRDKKFCDVHCKTTYHNRNSSYGEEMIKHYNSTLRHNRRILRTLCPEGLSTVRRDVLEKMGFKYRFFTDVFRSEKGFYYLCYDYGFMPISKGKSEKALIIQRQDYMNEYAFDPWNITAAQK